MYMRFWDKSVDGLKTLTRRMSKAAQFCLAKVLLDVQRTPKSIRLKPTPALGKQYNTSVTQQPGVVPTLGVPASNTIHADTATSTDMEISLEYWAGTIAKSLLG